MIEFAVIHSSNIRIIAGDQFINRNVLMFRRVLMRPVAEHTMIQFAVIHPVDVRIRKRLLRSNSQEASDRQTTKNDRIPRHMLFPLFGSG